MISAQEAGFTDALSGCAQQDLFTHCRVSDHLALLGYGDGTIKQLDMRKPKDWYCLTAPQVFDKVAGMH